MAPNPDCWYDIMDSPLLPSTSRFHAHDASIDSLQLQDLSFGQDEDVADDDFLAPAGGSSSDDEFARPPPAAFRSSLIRQSSPEQDQPAHDGEDSVDDATPVKKQPAKGKSKPRFSLFAVQNTEPDDEEDEDEQQQQSTSHQEESYQVESSPPPQARRAGKGRQVEDESVRSEAEGERPLSLSQLGTTLTSSVRPQPSSEERDAFLKRALFDLQRINGVFETYIQTVEGVNAYHARVQAQSTTTAKLLQTYISILDSTNTRSTFVSARSWSGAEADVSAHLARQTSLIAAEQAALRDRIEREEAEARARERKAREREDELAKQAMKVGAGRGGGDGGARGTRGIGRPRGRGWAGGAPSGIPSARGKIPSYSSVKSSGYGPPVAKKKAA